MNTVTIKIDGVSVSATEGQSVLRAALDAGIYIPHLCHHPDLPDIGACGLCLVEYDGKIVSSCTLKVQEGMSIRSKSEKLNQRRELALKLLLAAHPEDCSTCPKYGNCELQTLMQYMGVSPEGLNRRLKPIPYNDRNPLIVHDMSRCILCGRCVRACQKVRGVGAIDYQKKDGESYIGTPAAKLLVDADCRFCGACVSVCPTGALMDKKEPNNPKGYAAPCKHACPAGTNVPEYVRLVKEGRYEEASCLIHERLPIPRSLGHVCSHPCETACRHECLNEAVSIRNLKLTAVEHDPNKVWKTRRKQLAETGKRVAIVGAGPCGLSAAYYLRKQGHTVTVFESQPEAGGMLRYGIPEYRMPRNVVREEIADLTETGFEIRCGSRITDYQKLSSEYDAVVVAIGNQQGVRLPIPGNDKPQVYVNLDFLRRTAEGNPPVLGKNVLVLGGGNVAFDCARTAVRLGAETVQMACLESEETLPGDREELEAALEEGIQMHFSRSFLEIVGAGDSVEGVKTIEVSSMHFDENRKLVLGTVPGSEQVIPCDTVIFAVGQRAELAPEYGMQIGRGNSAVVDENGRTSLVNVFAAGDVTYGTQSVVRAVASGRSVAESVDRFLGGNGDTSEKLVELEPASQYIGKIPGFAAIPRVHNVVLPAEERKKRFMRAEQSFTCEQACKEAGRCLQCQLREAFHAPRTWNEFEKGGAAR